MLKFDLVVKCILPAVLSAGIASQAAAGNIGWQNPTAARYGNGPAMPPMMSPRNSALAPAVRWPGMRPWPVAAARGLPPNPDRSAAASHRTGPVPSPQRMWSRAPSRAWSMPRYQRPFPPQPIYGARPTTPSMPNRLAQYRPPMAPPAPIRASAPPQAVAMARYQRSAHGQPIYAARPMTPPNIRSRLAQYRPPMTPAWGPMPQTIAMARYQRPAFRQPIYGPRPETANMPNRLAQYRPPVLPPMWPNPPRQSVAMANFPRPAFGPQLYSPRLADRNAPPSRVARFRPPMSPMWANAPRQLAMYPFPGTDRFSRPTKRFDSTEIHSPAELAALTDTAPSRAETPAEQLAEASAGQTDRENEMVTLARAASPEARAPEKQAADEVDKVATRMSEFAVFSLIPTANASELESGTVSDAKLEQAPQTADEQVISDAEAGAPAAAN